jgi:hypothetical protein
MGLIDATMPKGAGHESNLSDFLSLSQLKDEEKK